MIPHPAYLPTTVTYRHHLAPSLQEAQRFVGGFVELVPLKDDAQLLVNDDGLACALPFNLVASQLAGFPVLGNAIILYGMSRWT